VRIFVGNGISGSRAGETPYGNCRAIGNIFSRATIVLLVAPHLLYLAGLITSP